MFKKEKTILSAVIIGLISFGNISQAYSQGKTQSVYSKQATFLSLADFNKAVNADKTVKRVPVTFKKQDLKIAGLLFTPANIDNNKKYPAIVVVHPGGGIKEQASSLYAYNLAKKGYIAIAFDATYQGASEGQPRGLENPTSRVEDVRSAVDYITTLPYVDQERIGALGICAGGGYAVAAATTEHRI